MKLKASITLSDDVLAAVDELAGEHGSRSAVIERVPRDFLSRRAPARGRATELARLNRHADRLNAHAADVLDYQVSRVDLGVA
jgi:metal-responsive CopG/Arc/MetJ family transcriptional regulator